MTVPMINAKTLLRTANAIVVASVSVQAVGQIHDVKLGVRTSSGLFPDNAVVFLMRSC
jgi:hypothetical protein